MVDSKQKEVDPKWSNELRNTQPAHLFQIHRPIMSTGPSPSALPMYVVRTVRLPDGAPGRPPRGEPVLAGNNNGPAAILLPNKAINLK